MVAITFEIKKSFGVLSEGSKRAVYRKHIVATLSPQFVGAVGVWGAS